MNAKLNANNPECQLRLDQTGEFFHEDRKKKPVGELPKREEWEELFLKEAFFLYENRKRILSDIRMALTPTPFRNGLAYSGSSGMCDATLGVYLEWWESCRRSVIMYDGEAYALTYYIAGSPLSGSNSCSAVTRQGKKVKVHFWPPFSELWGPFMNINRRYAELKDLHPAQAYTLEETIAKLRETHE